MIKFINNNKTKPYLKFQDLYKKALSANQNSIEAIAISSYDSNKKEVDSRFVNLKIVDNEKFIFFSNYCSPKSVQFNSFNQISVLIFWESLNIQIRLKAKIKKLDTKFNDLYFSKRDKSKNALAISSNQSKIISSYNEVTEKYEQILKKNNLSIRPDYWGGFEFTPYSFEFWKGHESRINKREIYILEDCSWKKHYLEP